jgi:hypothetical protein
VNLASRIEQACKVTGDVRRQDNWDTRGLLLTEDLAPD